MDDAEKLGDRIGIMFEGELVSSGSPLFLQEKFGIGMRLEV
jgi:ABC-type multidrug transport system ATPase subunit